MAVKILLITFDDQWIIGNDRLKNADFQKWPLKIAS